jgi:predicted nucleic acid-binding Zn ribbon protein
MSENTVIQKFGLECGHEAEFTFSGTDPNPNLTCPECGAPDKLNHEQVGIVKKLFLLRSSAVPN